jgi:hypothetical protein
LPLSLFDGACSRGRVENRLAANSREKISKFVWLEIFSPKKAPLPFGKLRVGIRNKEAGLQ